MRDPDAPASISQLAHPTRDATATGAVAVRLLGPFELSLDGRPVELTTGRLRALLAILAMSAGKTVSVEHVTAAMWDDDLPVNARRSVQTYVTRLRSLLGPPLIGTRPGGYVLQVDPGQVDALRFLRLAEAASSQQANAARRALLADALSLWRGKPFAGVRSAWLEESETPRLLERYLTALEQHIDMDLADGRHGELVAELSQLTVRFPLRESLWVRLLVALDGCGRHAEALAQYETIRVRIADELGADPGPDLQRVYSDLLIQGTPSPGSERSSMTTGRTPPHQLPADIDSFVGRAECLKDLEAFVHEDGHRSVAPMIALVHGAPAVGKTTLVVHWAHAAQERFIDGQLYLDLQGYGAAGPAMDSGEALRTLLDALGVPPAQIPAGVPAQSGLYRSLLAGKRMLVVLDNANTADQVRPLLPGSPTCVTVVTSREQLMGLVTADGAHPIGVDLLTPEESRELLARRLGEDQVAADPRAVDDIVERCARLPLALAIVAARAAMYPTFPLAALAAQLDESRANLDAFTVGDPVTDIRAIFSWSYRTLSPGAARLFRHLASHPGPDIGVPAAASLGGLPARRARQLLDELARAHLAAECSPGRYSLHDLLRAYATELADAQDARTEGRQALHRVLDHYLHTAYAAGRLLDPRQDPIVLDWPQVGVLLEDIADHEHALAWFTAEYSALLAALAQASSDGFDAHTFYLAVAIWPFMERQGRWHDLVTTENAALTAARGLADQAGEATTHRALAIVYAMLSRFDDAHRELHVALELAREIDDLTGQARIHRVRGWVHARQGGHTEALACNGQALELYRRTGDRAAEAGTLTAIGWNHASGGDPRQALAYCQQALTLQQEIGQHEDQAAAWDGLGQAQHNLGHHKEAVNCYQRALDLHRKTGHRLGAADTRIRLGDTHQAAGNRRTARAAWREALATLDELGHPDAELVRHRLRQA